MNYDFSSLPRSLCYIFFVSFSENLVFMYSVYNEINITYSVSFSIQSAWYVHEYFDAIAMLLTYFPTPYPSCYMSANPKDYLADKI